jgi:hypothetical protein
MASPQVRRNNAPPTSKHLYRPKSEKSNLEFQCPSLNLAIGLVHCQLVCLFPQSHAISDFPNRPLLNPIVTLPAPWLMRQFLSWTWSIFIPVMLLWNIWTAVSPLFRAPDNLPDIPLTPTQRSLLGLDPNATPPHTPGTTYITPPRYPRSVSDTPKSRSSSATGSPSSRSGSPLLGKTQNGTAESPYSQNTSPLWQKAVGGRETRRHSYALASPLGLGGSGMGKESVYNIPSTPSPTGGKGSIPLNSKWLFEKGRR